MPGKIRCSRPEGREVVKTPFGRQNLAVMDPSNLATMTGSASDSKWYPFLSFPGYNAELLL